jgi:hypothetical protein
MTEKRAKRPRDPAQLAKLIVDTENAPVLTMLRRVS